MITKEDFIYDMLEDVIKEQIKNQIEESEENDLDIHIDILYKLDRQEIDKHLQILNNNYSEFIELQNDFVKQLKEESSKCKELAEKMTERSKTKQN